MKFNLKTFPSSKTEGYPEQAKTKDDYIRHAILISDWFEGFKKELREELSGTSKPILRGKEAETYDMAVKNVIKEIFGRNIKNEPYTNSMAS